MASPPPTHTSPGGGCTCPCTRRWIWSAYCGVCRIAHHLRYHCPLCHSSSSGVRGACTIVMEAAVSTSHSTIQALADIGRKGTAAADTHTCSGGGAAHRHRAEVRGPWQAEHHPACQLQDVE